jgi:pyruvate carboxylase subunit B
VYAIYCKVGDKVKKDDTLAILEAMKMETPLKAPENGTIVSVDVEKGMTVKAGQLIATLR